VPDEVAGSSANLYRAMAASNSAGQGCRESPPAVTMDGHTDQSVVDRHIQFSTAEGCDPDVVSMSDQSVVRDANVKVGVDTPTVLLDMMTITWTLVIVNMFAESVSQDRRLNSYGRYDGCDVS